MMRIVIGVLAAAAAAVIAIMDIALCRASSQDPMLKEESDEDQMRYLAEHKDGRQTGE